MKAPAPTHTPRAPKMRAPKPPKLYDPFAPMTVKQVNHAGDIYGPVMGEKQIQATAGREARAQINPLVAAITKEIAGHEAAAQTNLGGATRSYIDAVSNYAPTVGAAYQGAESKQAGVDAAVQQALNGQGAGLAAELAKKLEAAGQSAAPAATVAANATGAGNAAYATGSAELSRLIADEAAARDYGAKLPGIAANTGLQRSAELAGKYADQLNTRTGEVTQQLPALIQNLVNSLRATAEARRGNKAAAVTAAENRATNNAVFRKEYGLKEYSAKTDRAKAKASARTAAERNAISAANAQTSATNAATSAARASETARHNKANEQAASERTAAAQARAHGTVDEAASRSRGILIGKDGKPILRYKVKNGKRVKGTGRTIPYKPAKSSSSSSSSGGGLPLPKPKGK